MDNGQWPRGSTPSPTENKFKKHSAADSTNWRTQSGDVRNATAGAFNAISRSQSPQG